MRLPASVLLDTHLGGQSHAGNDCMHVRVKDPQLSLTHDRASHLFLRMERRSFSKPIVTTCALQAMMVKRVGRAGATGTRKHTTYMETTTQRIHTYMHIQLIETIT